jgi:hypothetical protein
MSWRAWSNRALRLREDDLPMLLRLTRGPSFGLVGPKELGVPPEVFG